MQKKKLTCIDLFCGCGGLSKGFLDAGYNVLLGIDNDDAALQTFSFNHKGATVMNIDLSNHENIKIITDFLEKRHVSLDVLIGGPPCQGFSISGFRDMNDKRNLLYQAMVKLAKNTHPMAILLENVPGMITTNNGIGAKRIVDDFAKIGYKMSPKLLCASDFSVPQKRKRVIFIGLKNDDKFDFPKPSKKIVTVEEALSDLPPLENDLGDEKSDYATAPQNSYQKMMRKTSSALFNHVAAKHSERVKKIISLVPDGGNYKDLPEEYRNTRNFHIAWTRFASDNPAPTIDTGHRHHFHYKYNRVPTVRECARLQSFPDDFIFIGSKTEQFRQVGNAVPPLLAKKIAIQLKQYL